MTATTPVLPSVPTPFPPFTLRLPEGDPLPLICDSPHSGTKYPEDFGYAVPFDLLRAGEDTDVHVLWDALPSVGATLLAAEFPRAYIDPNRDIEDIDAGMLAEPWPTPLSPSEKTRLGIGLIWRDAKKNGKGAIYDRKLPVAEVQSRIATYHAPYHAAMREHIEAAYARFGAVWHLNLHSMPADSYEGLQIQSDHPLADFVLGDRDGTTAAPEFTVMVAEALKKRGFNVAINDPFKGVALIARLGWPAERRHSLQIEVHRGLYMNEITRERSAGFDALQDALAGVSQDIAHYVKDQLK
ncbi:N-formylglutamate amidohydrolase [Variovorax ginsengisoli]|uniref:N-formylglutamate deformylase n=1 Tax=Variovorax ginsengisoli TaxID=363844 RepID=A0ABT9S5H6_9BURK|nr:N-formylglutamate amidohydrolase [Variovorax ginsengisoli]MDP9898592.1 N-formylglutamate deformylase [Variovorax ginsengisoli]